TAGVNLKKGRWFSGRRGAYETVINGALAKSLFGNEDPIGKSFRLQVSGDYAHLVVGVVGGVNETVRSSPGRRFYAPVWVSPQTISTVLLRLDGTPSKEFEGLVRRAIYEFDPALIVSEVSSMDEIIAGQ